MMLWILLLAVPMLLGLYAQIRVSSAYAKNAQIGSSGRITGREAAEAVLASAGITDVEIVEVAGHLTDHFDPSSRRLALSSENYHGESLAALGVSAHEAGHAIQQKVGYAMMNIRQALVPMVRIASPAVFILFAFGFGFLGTFGKVLLPLAVVALVVMTLFQLVTLPVEFDASRRAKAQLVGLGIVTRDEMVGVAETLDAAALTYVAAFVSSLGNLLYLLLALSGSRRHD